MNVINRSRPGLAARTAFSGMLALVLCYLIMFVELPYYIFQPGTAESIGNMVQVENGGYPESGKLLLTTVGVSKTNVVKLIEAELRSYDVRRIAEVRKDGESDQEYGERQHQIMLTSQASALQAAYRAAGIPYRIENAGISVLRTASGYPAHGILEAGDTVIRVEGEEVKSGTELSKAFAKKKAGDSVRVEYRRGSNAMEAAFTLRALPRTEGETGERLGIGLTTADLQRVQPDQPGKRVTIEAGEIGGPSAGFMFALEIYGLLLPEDLTKGYTIAGTGTIEPDGRIGVIGGIRHKVVAADREGADLFFAPKDYRPAPANAEKGELPILNAAEAEAQARRIGSRMKVVPVGSLEEAIAYLTKLPPKAGGS
jgi:Lon-like protease